MRQALWCGPRRRARTAAGEEPRRVELEHAPPFAEQFGIRLVAVEEGRATATLPVGSPGLADDRRVRRGAITLLIEAAAMATTLGSERPSSRAQGPSDLFVSFLGAMPDHPLTAEARVVGRAGSRENCEVEVRDWNGALVAKGFLSCEV